VVFGYDQIRLQQQGTTATHIVFSSVSRFDAFVATFVNVALEPALYSKVVTRDENADDVAKFAAGFVVHLCADMQPQVYSQILGAD